MKRGWILVATIGLLLMTFLAPSALLGTLTGLIMNNTLLGIIAGGILGFLLTIYVGIYIVPSQILAPRNMFFTTVSEGTAVFVVRGRRIEKVLMEWKGHILDEQWNVRRGEPQRGFWNRKFGITFYGWWPFVDVLWYKFRWSGITEDNKPQHKHEWLRYVIVRDDVYWAMLDNAEDSEGLHIDVELIFTIRVINPYRAKFNIQNWLEAVIQRSREPLLEYVRTISYEKFLTTDQGQSQAGEAMLQKLEDAKLVGPNGDFEKTYGAKVKAIQVRAIEPPPEYREQTLKKFTAEREAEAIGIRAEAEAERLGTVYSKIQQFGDVGKLIRSLEAVERSPLAASLTVQAIPGLSEVFRGVFGRSVPEEITKEDVRKLREELEKLGKIVEKLPGGETRQ